MTISQSRAPFERGSKLVRKTVLTDSRFPGTTELLSPASVELKGVRANLEEQVRILVDCSLLDLFADSVHSERSLTRFDADVASHNRLHKSIVSSY